MSEKKIVILSRSFAKSSNAPLELLKKHGISCQLKRNDAPEDVDGIAAKIGLSEAVILGNDTLNKTVMDRCPNLKFVSKQGAGLDSIDLDYARQRGIEIKCTPTANSEAVADMALALMLSVQRDLKHSFIKEKTPDWCSKGMSHDLFGKCVGLVGFGNIGKAVAHRLMGFSVKTLVYCRHVPQENTYGVSFVTLEELLANSDIVSIHVPLTAETRTMVNRDFLASMKDGAALINVSRGGIIDENALYEALTNGHLRAAGLDVFAQEPPVDNRLLELDNVIGTPHIAPHTVETSYRMGMQAAQNIVNYFERN